MPDQPNIVVSDIRPKPLPLTEVWDRVDPLAADLSADPAQNGLAGLPYFKLAGPGFERLVYELLQSENQRPWFFGRTGQAQYGTDIITEVAGFQDIYQCKNYAEAPSWPQVRAAVAKFESEWMNDMNLPTPREFVYCCPHPLNDSSFDGEWVKLKDTFKKSTGVALSFWDRHTLDSKLRRLPDLVASLFSDSYAEHFCGRDDWRDDPWARLQRGHARFPGINRFLERHDRNAIYVAESHEQHFLEALDQSSVVALRGLPGMGKTFLALELACRLRHPLRRIYYATLKDGASAERLWQSVRRRLSLPSLFVLDDCHLAPKEAESVLERLGPELENGKLKLVLLLRDQVGTGTEQTDDTPEWFARLEDDQAIIDLHADVTRTLAVACHLRPNFTGLSDSRLARLHDSCGGDLLLLDEVLQTVTTPQEVDTLELTGLLARVRSHYFGGNGRLPTLTKLSALAQFDLLPLTDFLEGQWRSGEERLADPLMTRLFSPPRYQFLHSSLAGLVLRALAQLDGRNDALDDTAASISVAAMRDYLLFLRALPDRSGEFVLTIKQFLRGALALWDNPSHSRIKAAVLSDKEIEAAIEMDLIRFNFAWLGLCVHWLSAAEHSEKAHYIGLIEERFRILFENTISNGKVGGMGTIGFGLHTLRRHAPERLAAVLGEHGAQSFLRLIMAKGTLFDVFKVLQHATLEFSESLLEQFTSAQATELLDKTIKSGCSIGTLNLGMRELGKADPELLSRLENVVGAAGLVRLILANGTIYELFKVLDSASHGFRAALLDQISSPQAEALLDKTIIAGRSIGTLHLTMRELGKTDPKLLARLENSIGALGFLRLIHANGTLFELFRVLGYATPEFRTTLLDQLTPAQATALLDKTIKSGRSIGTLNFTLLELGETDHDFVTRLENVIRAPGFIRLILANGTLFELFRVLQDATSGFRKTLLKELTSDQAATLLDKTIASGRSIGTLNLTLRKLREDEPALLVRLEKIVGVRGFLRLILANGTLFELFMVLKCSSLEFQSALIEHLTPAQATTLLDKTIVMGRSIGTLNLAMWELGNSDPELLARLENVIGAPNFLRLILANGSLYELFNVLHDATQGFRTMLLGQVTSPQAAILLESTVIAARSIEHFHYTLRRLASSSNQRTKLEDLLGVEGWWKLFIARGTLNGISQITLAMSNTFRAQTIAAATIRSVADWCNILGRGFFWNACEFVKNDLPSFPQTARDTFRIALMETAETLANRASWSDLILSRPPTDPQNAEGATLCSALGSRMKAVQITELFELEFVEAANALACCWRERSDLRHEIGANLRKILPPREKWSRKKGEVSVVSLFLPLVRNTEFCVAEAQWLTREVLAFLDHKVCKNMEAITLFLVLWNIAALSYENGTEGSFASIFPKTTQEMLIAVVADRPSPRLPSSEKLGLFALIGLLVFLFPQSKLRLVKFLAPLKGEVRWLTELAKEQGFVMAVFALEGITLQGVRDGGFTPFVCLDLLLKCDSENDNGPAVKRLRLHVSEKHNRKA